MKNSSKADLSFMQANSDRCIKEMDAAETQEELAEAIRDTRIRLEARFPAARES